MDFKEKWDLAIKTYNDLCSGSSMAIHKNDDVDKEPLYIMKVRNHDLGGVEYNDIMSLTTSESLRLVEVFPYVFFAYGDAPKVPETKEEWIAQWKLKNLKLTSKVDVLLFNETGIVPDNLRNASLDEVLEKSLENLKDMIEHEINQRKLNINDVKFHTDCSYCDDVGYVTEIWTKVDVEESETNYNKRAENAWKKFYKSLSVEDAKQFKSYEENNKKKTALENKIWKLKDAIKRHEQELSKLE